MFFSLNTIGSSVNGVGTRTLFSTFMPAAAAFVFSSSFSFDPFRIEGGACTLMLFLRPSRDRSDLVVSDNSSDERVDRLSAPVIEEDIKRIYIHWEYFVSEMYFYKKNAKHRFRENNF